MSKRLEFTGWYSKNGNSSVIPTIQNPSNEQLLLWLNVIESANVGKVKLENLKPETDTSPENLTLSFENDNYLLMLFDFDENGDVNIRSTHNSDSDKSYINILGDDFSSALITHDFNIVKISFIEFNNNLNVSKEILT